MAPINTTLSPRQSTASSTTSCPNSLSSGAIAGIVIGTIAGTLLILWLIRLCQLPGAWSFGGEPDPGYRPPVTRTHGRRRRRRPSVVEYTEKPVSRRYPTDVRRPERVYVT
ncbi:hypothetical protein N7474_005673 [Penicillium riverlandense]|uniref:uncharacterized protein n=1 Tax=Penicillium riverlandense TaxID=1903569 RepID=UPI00254748DC|nr:uncharacterized protein N7474_005673 [Penicillium riverlandense]KAJ5820082.1 hypothetical protein N7474_005673 [Penicillium riverlandense]